MLRFRGGLAPGGPLRLRKPCTEALCPASRTPRATALDPGVPSTPSQQRCTPTSLPALPKPKQGHSCRAALPTTFAPTPGTRDHSLVLSMPAPHTDHLFFTFEARQNPVLPLSTLGYQSPYQTTLTIGSVIPLEHLCADYVPSGRGGSARNPSARQLTPCRACCGDSLLQPQRP